MKYQIRKSCTSQTASKRGQWQHDFVNVIIDFSCKTKTSSYNIRADIYDVRVALLRIYASPLPVGPPARSGWRNSPRYFE